MRRMTIGELARRAGVGVETVRYYQRRQLLPEPPRRARGFREYGEESLRTLRFIRRAKGLGFTLKEIAGLLAMRRVGSQGHERLLDVVGEKQAHLERQIAELQIASRALLRLRAELELLSVAGGWALLDPELEPREESRPARRRS